MGVQNKKSEVARFDDGTRKWFRNRMSVQTTVEQCARCGLWYKPSLGHKCKKKGE